MEEEQNWSASFDCVWTDEKEAELERCRSKLHECGRAKRLSSESRKWIARLASACARLQDKRDYAKHVAIQEYLEPLIEAYFSKKLSDGNLTWRDFQRFSKILGDIEKQKLLRLQWSCAAG
jgi:hypothetical protein